MFDEFNLLGLKSDKPPVTNQSDVANPSVDDDDEGFHTPDEVMQPVQEDDENQDEEQEEDAQELERVLPEAMVDAGVGCESV